MLEEFLRISNSTWKICAEEFIKEKVLERCEIWDLQRRERFVSEDINTVVNVNTVFNVRSHI